MALCAVEGCTERGKSQVCPHDGRRHYHGCIHYDGSYPKHSLTFRKDGWYWICDTHYEIVKREREEWEQEKATGKLNEGAEAQA